MFKNRMFGNIPRLYIVLGLFALIKLTIHILTANNYGYNNDELYAIAISKHLALGYVDLPPIVPALLALSRVILGESVFAVHILPALIGSITVIFVGLITNELGGRLYAISITCLAYIITPTWLAFNSFFGYDGFDQLALAVFLLILVTFLKSNNEKLWVALGISAALCTLIKATILFYGAGFLLALIILGYRCHFTTRWPYLGLGFFLLIISPYMMWQVLNHFPTLDYWTAYKDHGTHHASPIEYLITIIIIMNPFNAPLWIIGIHSIVKSKPQENKARKFFGIMSLVSIIVIYVLNGKSTMVVALFIPIFSFAAIWIEDKFTSLKKVRITSVAYMTVAGIVFAPISIPILPPDILASLLGGDAHQHIQLDNNKQGQLPAHLATRFGWDNMAKIVSKVFNSLSEDDQKKCGIFASDYDQAGAIDLLGPKYGLNRNAISGRLTYYLWGYGNFNGEIMLSIGLEENFLKSVFNEVTISEIIHSDFAMPEDTNLPVYICRGLKIKVEDFWQGIKNY